MIPCYSSRNGLPKQTVLHIAAVDLMASQGNRGHCTMLAIFIPAAFSINALLGGGFMRTGPTVFRCGQKRRPIKISMSAS